MGTSAGRPESSDSRCVAKSPLVVLAIGIAGCLLLALMLREAVGLREERERPPGAELVEQRFAAQLAGRVRFQSHKEGDGVRRVLTAPVRDGVDRRRLPKAIGTELWLALLRSGAPTGTLEVRLENPNWSEPVVVVVPPPRLGDVEPAVPTPPQHAQEPAAPVAR